MSQIRAITADLLDTSPVYLVNPVKIKKFWILIHLL
jgi:hypothetical protein